MILDYSRFLYIVFYSILFYYYQILFFDFMEPWIYIYEVNTPKKSGTFYCWCILPETQKKLKKNKPTGNSEDFYWTPIILR